MKTLLTPGALLALGLALAGCGASHDETAHTHAHEHLPAATYKEGYGLRLSARGAQFAGLETSAVAPRTLAGKPAAAAIPAAALLRTIKGDFVYVANGGWFLRTAVKIGARDDAWCEIAEGLYEGDTVVVRGVPVLWLAEVHAVNGGVGCAHGH